MVSRSPSLDGTLVGVAQRHARNRSVILPVMICFTLLGCAARLVIDESMLDSPALAGVLLIAALAVLLPIGREYALVVFLVLPALFGGSPWNSPVHAYIGSESFPLYIYDAVLVICATLSTVSCLRGHNEVAKLWFQANWIGVTLIASGLVAKIARSGLNGEALRNAALFYYFPAVCLTAALAARRIDVKQIVPVLYLRSLAVVGIAPLLVLLGLWLGLGDAVTTTVQQEIVLPAGALEWLPPGSLLLLTFCASAFLPDPRTGKHWKALILLLLLYDFVTYLNRAMWIGIFVGIAASWIIRKGLLRGFLPALLLSAAAVVVVPPLSDAIRAGHNESSEWRLLAWGLTAGAIIESPISGHSYSESLLAQIVGLPESKQAMHEASLRISEQARSPHNSYLSLLFFGGLWQGLPILVFIIAALLSLARLTRHRRRERRPQLQAEAVLRGAIAAVVYSAFNVVLESPVEGITFWMILYCTWQWSNSLRTRHAKPVASTAPPDPLESH